MTKIEPSKVVYIFLLLVLSGNIRLNFKGHHQVNEYDYDIIHYSVEFTVGFEQSLYLVSEGAGTVEVCISIQAIGDVLLTGDSSTTVLLMTQSATASCEYGDNNEKRKLTNPLAKYVSIVKASGGLWFTNSQTHVPVGR